MSDNTDKDNSLSPLSLDLSFTCRVHKGEVIKFYCETCNTAICLPCTFLEHKDHEIEEIKAMNDSSSSDLSLLVEQVGKKPTE